MATFPTPTFIIRDNPAFVRYVKDSWSYFLKNKIEGCKITIRKPDVFIHIDHLYCVIFNDLVFIQRNPDHYHLEMNSEAKKLLARYSAPWVITKQNN